MTSRPVVIVAPHSDDMALWAGGFVLGNAAAVRVVTVLCGVAGAGPAHEWDMACGFADARDAGETRRAEDRAACAFAGVPVTQLDFLDGPYGNRHDPAAIEAALSPLLTGAELVLLPAGIGDFGDHVVVRDAGLAAATVAGVPARLYADSAVPRDGAVAPGAQGWYEWQPPALPGLAEPLHVGLDPVAAARKMALVRHYASQLAALGRYLPELTHVRGDLATEVFWDVRVHGGHA